MRFIFIKNRIVKLLLIFQLAFAPKLFAQNIAINTTGNAPDTSAMLDITSTTQGLLMPRMTTAQMNAIVLPATGLLIYNTSLNIFEVNIGTSSSPNWVPIETTQSGTNTLSSSGNTITSTVNGVAATAPAVNTVGNTISGNTVLTTVNGVPGSAVTVPNIYTADGTLTANRTVTQGANTLAFTSTATNGFSIAGSTFSVDGANSRVGIGTVTPLNTLHVVSPTASNNRFNLFDGANGTNGNVLVAFRNTSALATGNQALIGFTNNGPTIAGANWAFGSVRTGNSNTLGAEEDFIIENSLGSNYLPRLKITDGGNVGIGTTSPSAQLHTTGTVRFAGLSASTGNTNLLTADASGNITTTTSSSILGTGTNTLTNTANTITSTVNGVAATAPAINTVSNTVSGNTVLTTVNGVPGSAVTVPNIYTADGTVAANRTVTQGTNTLTFTSSVINGFSVDGTTFSVDAANNRIGLGTASPKSTLQVSGSVAATVTEVTASTTLDETYHFVDVNSSSATTITLPAVTGITGREYIVRNVNSGTVTISVNGGGNLRVGSTTTTSITLTNAGQSYTLVAGSTNWEVITPVAGTLPTMVLAATSQTLTVPGAGGAVNVSFSSPSVNTIAGASFNSGTSQITLPAGTYMVTWSYYGTVTMSGGSAGAVACFWDVPGAGNRATYSSYASSSTMNFGTNPVFYPILTSSTAFNFSIGTATGTAATGYSIGTNSRLYIVKIS